jgi:hypothetical protein
MEFDPRLLQYKVLDKTSLHSADKELYSRAYAFWKQTWQKIFTDVGSPEAFWADDFYRQDYVPVITYDGQITAAHFYTVFDFDHPAVKDHRYFSIFTPFAMKWVEREQPSRVMSMEFLTVHPEWRKKDLGFSMAEVLISLGLKLMKEKDVQVAVGVAVKAAGVEKMAQKLSCQLIAQEVKRGNLVCDIMGQTPSRLKPHPDDKVNALIEDLWARKSSFPNQTIRRVA